jgi:hypothetical protein
LEFTELVNTLYIRFKYLRLGFLTSAFEIDFNFRIWFLWDDSDLIWDFPPSPGSLIYSMLLLSYCVVVIDGSHDVATISTCASQFGARVRRRCDYREYSITDYLEGGHPCNMRVAGKLWTSVI